MLRQISIKAFALIEEIDIEVGSGMTVLLGETGAGKSIIIDALAAALGERTSSDVVRVGAKKAVVEAIFVVNKSSEIQNILEREQLVWDSADLVLRREIMATGTSRCFVNDSPTQASVVREISAYLVDFHGQHDTHGLFQTARHRAIVDAAGGTAQDLVEMGEAWDRLQLARKDLQVLADRALAADSERARLEFVLNEVTSVNPQPNEDEAISTDLRLAESGEQLVVSAESVRALMYTGSPSAYDLIGQARDSALRLAVLDPRLESLVADIDACLVLCKEVSGAVARLAEPQDFSPERLESLRQRQADLQRLIRKYRSLENAISECEKSVSALNELENMQAILEQAEENLQQAEKSAKKIARRLSEKRKSTATPLTEGMRASLQEMGMSHANLAVIFGEEPLGPLGIDNVEIHFSANAGEPLRPLAKVASGGELSRVMLAIKTTMAARASVGTMVFDEIDSGISGRVARTVGDVMKTLSSSQQILCITHLPQIASMADGFIKVLKTEDLNQTTVGAHSLAHQEALVEVARLLSGDDVTPSSLTGAKELMDSVKQGGSRTKG